MKTTITLLITLLISISSIAQDGINYKAIIKDASANVLANQSVDVRFTIELYGIGIYQEEHTSLTDGNGIIILNIGEGTTTDDFSVIPWNSKDISLDVEVDIGAGWVDMGDSTDFKTAPYAFYSDKSKESLKAGISEQIIMFESGTNNPDKMVIQHSEAHPDWGLQYSDIGDTFDFLADGGSTLKVNLNSGNLSTEGNIGIGTESPTSGLHVNTNSTVLNQNILLEEEGNDFARIGFTNTVSPANWDIAGLASNTPSAARLNFHYRNTSGAADRMSITGDGNVGIGTSNPSAKLHINQSGTGISDGLRFETGLATAEDWYVYMANDDDLIFRNDNVNTLTLEKDSGRVGIGTLSPTRELDVVGAGRFTGDLNVGNFLWVGNHAYLYSDYINLVSRLIIGTNVVPSGENSYNLGLSNRRWVSVWANDGTINTSDRREKTNIASLNYGLEDLMKLQPVSFNWKHNPSNDKKLGLIAQDLQQVIPEVVKTHEVLLDEKGVAHRKEVERMGVYYSDLIPVLIKAIQELKEENNNLKSRIEALEN